MTIKYGFLPPTDSFIAGKHKTCNFTSKYFVTQLKQVHNGVTINLYVLILFHRGRDIAHFDCIY